MKTMPPIVDDVRTSGDKAVLSYTQTFEKATSLTSSVIRAPFPEPMVQLPAETMAVDTLFENISKFHAAQKEEELLTVDTMLDMVCRRFVRPIKPSASVCRVGRQAEPSAILQRRWRESASRDRNRRAALRRAWKRHRTAQDMEYDQGRLPDQAGKGGGVVWPGSASKTGSEPSRKEAVR